VDRLPPGDVITPDDAEKALATAGLAVQPRDAVLFSTGHRSLWYSDPAAYAAGEPGPGTALAGWLVAHRVALTGCDTWSYSPYPAEDPDAPCRPGRPDVNGLTSVQGVVAAAGLPRVSVAE